MENQWVIHEMETTADFAHGNKVLSWYIGLMFGSLRVLWPWPNGTGSEESTNGAELALPAGDGAKLDEIVNTENGQWRIHGRTISDVHKAASMSMRDVIRHSSNIGIVKFASRLQPGEQYRYLRDFGFGTPTGVEYPSESSGRLRRPAS
mgnify:CR=1 FL=1